MRRKKKQNKVLSIIIPLIEELRKDSLRFDFVCLFHFHLPLKYNILVKKQIWILNTKEHGRRHDALCQKKEEKDRRPIINK